MLLQERVGGRPYVRNNVARQRHHHQQRTNGEREGDCDVRPLKYRFAHVSYAQFSGGDGWLASWLWVGGIL